MRAQEVRMLVARRREELAGLGGCVFVPTMGALHEGHASLIRLGVEEARRRGAGAGIVVSIFVNPTQFGEREDLDRYPRTEERDVALCRGLGVDVVFAPSEEVVYPPGEGVRVPEVPAVGREPGLEDAGRPGHFAGVCQVVSRLFELVRPSCAVFGEKDWQQLQVVRAMVERDGLGVEIVPGPTVRERDGLAMSSRNRFLSEDDRERALSLSASLCEACGHRDARGAEEAMRRVLGRAGVEAEYAVVRDARTLREVGVGGSGEGRGAGEDFRALVAGRVGKVRLIDNAPWPGDGVR